MIAVDVWMGITQRHWRSWEGLIGGVCSESRGAGARLDVMKGQDMTVRIVLMLLAIFVGLVVVTPAAFG